DLASLRIDVRPTTKREWTPVSVSPTRTGRKMWDPETKSDHEVRLKVLDRAGNEANRNVFVNPSRAAASRLAGQAGDGLSEPPAPSSLTDAGGRNTPSKKNAGRLVAESNAPMNPVRANGSLASSQIPSYFINKTKFHVNYKVEALGKSGYKSVQLYWRYPD